MPQKPRNFGDGKSAFSQGVTSAWVVSTSPQ